MPAKAQAPASTVIALGVFDYQIDGWQVRCLAGVRHITACDARRAFLGPVEARIRVGDDHILFEIESSCVEPPANYRTRTWDRRRPISTIDAARSVTAEINEDLRRCREEARSEGSVYEVSNLMFLLLSAAPIPAYVQMDQTAPR